MDRKKEDRFHLFNLGLSYRRKYIRTLWLIPFAFLLFFIWPGHQGIWGLLKFLLFMFIVVGIPMQALYYLWQWKKEEFNNNSDRQCG